MKKPDKTIVRSNLIHLEQVVSDAFNDLGDYGHISEDIENAMLKQFEVMKKLLKGKK